MTSNLLPFSFPSGDLLRRSLGYSLVLVVVMFCGWTMAQDADARSTNDFSAVVAPISASLQDDCSPGPLITESPPPPEQQNPAYTLLLSTRGLSSAGPPNSFRLYG